MSRIHIIPNGFDGDVEAFTVPPTDTLTILYTGTLSDYGYDGFLAALVEFSRPDPARARKMRVQFVGEHDAEVVKRVCDLGLAEMVSVRPPVSHAEVARLQREAHALLMLERRPSHTGYELLAGAKLFGYLRAGKPILGVVPHGEAERVLRDVGVSTIAEATSVPAILSALNTVFESWCAGRLGMLIPDPSACLRYSGKVQTMAMVRALEGLPAAEPFIPGAVDVVPSLRPQFADAGWV